MLRILVSPTPRTRHVSRPGRVKEALKEREDLHVGSTKYLALGQ